MFNTTSCAIDIVAVKNAILASGKKTLTIYDDIYRCNRTIAITEDVLAAYDVKFLDQLTTQEEKTCLVLGFEKTRENLWLYIEGEGACSKRKIGSAKDLENRVGIFKKSVICSFKNSYWIIEQLVQNDLGSVLGKVFKEMGERFYVAEKYLNAAICFKLAIKMLSTKEINLFTSLENNYKNSFLQHIYSVAVCADEIFNRHQYAVFISLYCHLLSEIPPRFQKYLAQLTVQYEMAKKELRHQLETNIATAANQRAIVNGVYCDVINTVNALPEECQEEFVDLREQCEKALQENQEPDYKIHSLLQRNGNPRVIENYADVSILKEKGFEIVVPTPNHRSELRDLFFYENSDDDSEQQRSFYMTLFNQGEYISRKGYGYVIYTLRKKVAKELVGCAFFVLFEENGEKECDLVAMKIKNTMTEQGCGSLLLIGAIEILRNRGYLVFNIEHSTREGAWLYLKLGFQLYKESFNSMSMEEKIKIIINNDAGLFLDLTNPSHEEALLSRIRDISLERIFLEIIKNNNIQALQEFLMKIPNPLLPEHVKHKKLWKIIAKNLCHSDMMAYLFSRPSYVSYIAKNFENNNLKENIFILAILYKNILLVKYLWEKFSKQAQHQKNIEELLNFDGEFLSYLYNSVDGKMTVIERDDCAAMCQYVATLKLHQLSKTAVEKQKPLDEVEVKALMQYQPNIYYCSNGNPINTLTYAAMSNSSSLFIKQVTIDWRRSANNHHTNNNNYHYAPAASRKRIMLDDVYTPSLWKKSIVTNTNKVINVESTLKNVL